MKAAALSGFRDRFKGQLIGPEDPGYDQARVVWNGMTDRRPALIARPTTVEDVVAAVRFAREHDLLIAVRGGGHSVAGFSTCDGGIVIDMSRMNRVNVDRERRTASSAGGAHLSQLDKQAQAAGLVCPVGVIGHTGVGGLTLGGGMGRLMRKFGLTIDNVLSVELVTADGQQLHVSQDENADLFWGLRGAGPNFGVATSFEYQLHPQDGTVTQGWVALPIERGHELAGVVREFLSTAPDHIFVNVAFGVAANPPFPAEMAGKQIALVGAMHSGSLEDAARDLRPLREALDWSVDMFAPKPYLSVQGMGDEANAWGHRFYMKSGYTIGLSDDLIATCAAQAANVPAGGDCSISLWAMGGAVGRVPDDAMAFTGRKAGLWFSSEAQWDGSEHDESHIAWSRRAMDACKPFTIVGEYVNDVVESDAESVRAIYGNEKYNRLVGLKRKYDPDNVFRLNQNIRP
ncbi:MAG: FAD-binding oxidoreductase [Candidatus Limnocylindrales bacterium]